MNLKVDWKQKLNQMAPKKQQLFMMLLAGILLVVIAIPSEPTEKKRTDGPAAARESGNLLEYEERLERRLEGILEHVAGVGKVEVMITLKSTAEKVIEKDRENTNRQIEEKDTQGGERVSLDHTSQETAIYNDSDGNQTPYVKKEMLPEIEGIIVIAQGGGNPVVIQNVTEAVQALFDVDTHKIKIMKMNQKK